MARGFVRLTGGLGNQLFQAAFVQWLNQTQTIPAILFDPGLDAIPGPLTRARQIEHILPDESILVGRRAKLLHRLSLSRKWQRSFGQLGVFCADRQEDWLEERLLRWRKLGGSRGSPWIVFSGYYQQRRYLDVVLVAMRVRAAIALKGRIERVEEILRQKGLPTVRESILLHVRRGDYLTTNGFKVLDTEYYARAWEFLGKVDPALTTKHVWVVSDSPIDALALVQSVYPAAQLLDLEDPLDVLAVIAGASVKIIANSTLSLWGALLGATGDVVAYPERWHETDDWGADLCRGRDWIELPSG